MVFQYVSWKELEPAEGKVAFEAWEKKAWDHARAKDKHVVLRVYVDYPSKPSGLPDWLRAQGFRKLPIGIMAVEIVRTTRRWCRPWSG